MGTIEHNGLIFELVDSVPLGYEIWNIGKNMVDGYVPLCRLSRNQPFPGGRNIETDTLKAIKVDGAQDVLAAIGFGPNTSKEMEAYVSRYGRSRTDWVRNRVERYKKAIPIMKQIGV